MEPGVNYGSGLFSSNKEIGVGGTGANGTVDLTSANTWYAVPSSIPTTDYILVATAETNAGTIRFGFSNSGTPSATNGNRFGTDIIIRIKGGQSLYFASSTAGDDINWTTKIL